MYNHGKRPGFDAIILIRPVQYFAWKDVEDVIETIRKGLNMDRAADLPVVYPGVPLVKPQDGRVIGGMQGHRGPNMALISILAYRLSAESTAREGLEIRAYEFLKRDKTPDGHKGFIEDHRSGFVK